MNPLFTIGHSSHPIEGFIELLKTHRIDSIADVRSQPYSRHYPWFCGDALKSSLREHGIAYVFLGKELGARRDEPECYVHGAVDYDRIAQTPAFLSGLERLRKGIQKYRIAMMCAEKYPLDCHRTVLVARHAATFAEVQHILSDGSIMSHADVEDRLLQMFDRDARDLFISNDERLKEAYTRQGRQIAYVQTDLT